MLSRCQTRRAVTRPVVCQPRREISLRGPLPPFLFFFFFPAQSTTKSLPMRGLRDDALLPRRARKTTTTTTTMGENPSKLDGGRVSESAGVKSRGSAASDSKLPSESNCAEKAVRGAPSFRCPDMIYNCEFCVIDGSFREIHRKILHE